MNCPSRSFITGNSEIIIERFVSVAIYMDRTKNLYDFLGKYANMDNLKP